MSSSTKTLNATPKYLVLACHTLKGTAICGPQAKHAPPGSRNFLMTHYPGSADFPYYGFLIPPVGHLRPSNLRKLYMLLTRSMHPRLRFKLKARPPLSRNSKRLSRSWYSSLCCICCYTSCLLRLHFPKLGISLGLNNSHDVLQNINQLIEVVATAKNMSEFFILLGGCQYSFFQERRMLQNIVPPYDKKEKSGMMALATKDE